MVLNMTSKCTLIYIFIFSGVLVNGKSVENVFDNVLNTLRLSTFHRNSTNGSSDLMEALNGLKSLQLLTEFNLKHIVRTLNSNATQNAHISTPLYSEVSSKALVTSSAISNICKSHLTSILESLFNEEAWALKMLDSAGKLPSGLLDGNFFWVGSFDECRRIKNIKVNRYVPVFDAKMCYIDIPLQKLLESFFGSYPATIHLGQCVPDSCSETDIRLLSNMLLKNIPLKQRIKVVQVECQENHLDLDTLAIAGICVCGFFAVLLIGGTTYDLYIEINKKNKETQETRDNIAPNYNRMMTESNKQTSSIFMSTEPGSLAKLLLSFSVYKNSKKIMSTEQASGALGAVNGIRFLSLSWVILGHSYITSSLYTENIAYFLPHTLRRWSDLVIVDALVSVDSFFALSGLLLSYLFLKEMKKLGGARKTNWFMFFFHRFWRLSPPFWLTFFVYISLFRYFGNGPTWKQEGLEKDRCDKNWWTSLIYINNFVHPDNMCFSWSWYLANDMQFFILSPLMLVPLYYSKIAGSVICFLFLLVNTIAAGVVSNKYDLAPTLYSMHPLGDKSYFSDYYVKPYCRIGPYVIGIFTGSLLYRWKGKCNINMFVNLVCWALTFVCTCLVIYGLHDYVKGGDMSTKVKALFNATHRSLWGACVCWVIFSCVTGHGGFINRILSWKAFIPLGRLSYCAYLVHPLVLAAYSGTLRTPMYLNVLNLIYRFLSNVVASYAVAFVVSLVFESPMMALEKVIFKRGQK